MAEGFTLIRELLAGVALGALFFGGLFWTVRKGLSARRPALWMFASLMFRTFIALAGFYVVGRGDWHRLLACLAGFVVARLVAMHFMQRETTLRVQSEAVHAPES